MNIAYVATYNARSLNAWSGTGYHIPKALEAAGASVTYVDALQERLELFFKAKQLVYRLGSKRYLRDREPLILRGYARAVEARLTKLKPDVILSQGTLPVAHLRADLPVAIWTDATFAGIHDFYPHFSDLHPESLQQGHAAERSALDRCQLALFSSEWAARSAVESYSVSPEKLGVVPFGANFEVDPTPSEVTARLHNTDVCRLLFIGVDWYRKGGDVALSTVRALRREGIKAELHLVGTQPPDSLPDFVKVHGFLDKAAARSRAALRSLLLGAHFLLMPSRAECFGIVFAEASSAGLPSLASRVGGVPSAVQSGKNGQLFAPGAPPETYSRFILELLASPERYAQLVASSLKTYHDKLNWGAAGHRALKHLSALA